MHILYFIVDVQTAFNNYKGGLGFSDVSDNMYIIFALFLLQNRQKSGKIPEK